MAAQREGSAKGRRHVGGARPACYRVAVSFDIGYTEMFPYNLPDNHMIDVNITSRRGYLDGHFSA
jgi:hypothetical protein